MTYDDIYGINLKEYCKRHNTTIAALQHKVEVDIDILSKRLNELKDDMFSEKFKKVYDTINKKRKHLERLKEWETNHG